MYKAILFSPDGQSVTDFKRPTKDEVTKELGNMGSRWIFYPLPFVATDKTIVGTCEGFEFLKGKRIETARKFIQSNSDAIIDRFF